MKNSTLTLNHSTHELSPEHLKKQEIAEVLQDTKNNLDQLNKEISLQATQEDIEWWYNVDLAHQSLEQENPTLWQLIKSKKETNNLRLYPDKGVMKFDVNFLYDSWKKRRNYNIKITNITQWNKVTWELAIPGFNNDISYQKSQSIDQLFASIMADIKRHEWAAYEVSNLEDNLRKTLDDMKVIFKGYLSH